MNALRREPLAPLGVLLAALALTWAPHAARFPLWLTALFTLTLALRLLWAHRGLPLPSRRWLLAPTLAYAVWSVWTFRPFFGGTGSLALLSGMTLLKLFEMRAHRDKVVLILLGYVLLGTRFLYEQTIVSALWMLGLAAVYTTLLAQAADATGSRSWRAHLGLAVRLLVQALPLAALLFFLFPRAGGPLWTLPTGSVTLTGLSEELSLAGITEVAQSEELVFRAEVEPTPPGSLYWRGLVYDVYDGRVWKSSGQARTIAPDTGAEGAQFRQRIVLEPQGKPWLFALDVPVSATRGALWGDGTLKNPVRLLSRAEYRAVSVAGGAARAMAPDARLTALAPSLDPRIIDLGKGFGRNGDVRDEEIARRAMAFFAEGGFSYTLSPPPAQGDPLAAFLLESRAGFCGHFASSLAVLLRAAGVPARVVAGYLGAEYNPLTDHWMVTQRHAHAWVEAWIEGRGWVRLDPTAAASPQRLSQGIDPTASAEEGRVVFGDFGGGFLSRIVTPVLLLWDGANHEWNLRVLGFNRERQKDLFRGLGLEKAATFALLSLGVVAAWVAVTAGWLAWRQRARLDPGTRTWRSFCRKLARRGLPPHAWEGPLDYAERAARAFPRAGPGAREVGRLYASWRYGEDRGALEALRVAVKAFDPGRGKEEP